MPDYMKNYRVVFIDENGEEHTKGAIAGYWEEDMGEGMLEPKGEPIFENLSEITTYLDAVSDFINSQLGLWKIENGKVVKFVPETLSAEEIAAKKL